MSNKEAYNNAFAIHFAPLQGFADGPYRRLHSQLYVGADAYYTPFIRMEHGEPRRQDMKRLVESTSDGTRLIPQIIFNSVDEFRHLTETVKALGFSHIDLNLGCPYPMQTRRGRGAAAYSGRYPFSHSGDTRSLDGAKLILFS